MKMLDMLPDVHQELVKKLELWNWSLVAPVSLDDEAEFKIIVTYGKVADNTFKKTYVVVFTEGLEHGLHGEKRWHINRIE